MLAPNDSMGVCEREPQQSSFKSPSSSCFQKRLERKNIFNCDLSSIIKNSGQ